MLKKPCVSRVFGHLFDLVRLVKAFALFKIISTVKTFMHSTLLLTQIVNAKLFEIKKDMGDIFLSYLFTFYSFTSK